MQHLLKLRITEHGVNTFLEMYLNPPKNGPALSRVPFKNGDIANCVLIKDEDGDELFYTLNPDIRYGLDIHSPDYYSKDLPKTDTALIRYLKAVKVPAGWPNILSSWHGGFKTEEKKAFIREFFDIDDPVETIDLEVGEKVDRKEFA